MKILIIGLGSIGKRHVRNLAKLYPDSQFFAYRERNLPLDEFGEKYNINIFLNLDEALSHEYDAVFITNPTSKHIPIALRAADRGNNLFIEKPVSHNMEGINKLRKIIRDKNLITFIGFNMRFHPGIKEMKNLLINKKLDKLYFARLQVGEYLPDWHPNEDYRYGYSARKELGGGVLLTFIHEIDNLIWLKSNPDKVCSVMSRVSNLEINVEDNVEVLLWYKDGFIAEINLNYLQKNYSRNSQIIGERGSLEWDYYKNVLTFYDNEKKEKEIIWRDSNFKRNLMYIEEVKHFIDCIRENKKPMIDLDEGIKSLKIVIAAKKSYKIGKFIEIEEGYT